MNKVTNKWEYVYSVKYADKSLSKEDYTKLEERKNVLLFSLLSIVIFSIISAVVNIKRLTEKPKQTYLYSFWDSAIISRSWIDPDKKKSDKIFENMIDGVLLGGDTTSGALRNAGDQLNLLLK